MTKQQIDKYAVGYPYPTNYIEILLRIYNYDTERIHEILCKSYEEVVEEVQLANSHIILMSNLDLICEKPKFKPGDYVENEIRKEII